jgi:hypothetical protein
VARFLALIAGVLLVLPAAAGADPAGPGDGTLAVSAATGSVSIAVRGALIGQVDRGRVVLEDRDPKDGRPPVVWGFESKRDVTDTKSLYAGTDIRFRIIGGFFRVKVVGTGLDLSLVGRGSVTLVPAAGLTSTGTYSVDGGPDLPFPDVLTSVQLGTIAAPGG